MSLKLLPGKGRIKFQVFVRVYGWADGMHIGVAEAELDTGSEETKARSNDVSIQPAVDGWVGFSEISTGTLRCTAEN